jgi:hypothetical protein
MTEEAVSQAEAKWGIVFPPDYRAFLVLGGPGSALVRWDGTQDKRIAELYLKLQEFGAPEGTFSSVLPLPLPHNSANFERTSSCGKQRMGPQE